MGILNYNFSIQGQSHKEDNIVCQDYSGILEMGTWNLAVVADGLGSCKYADIASKLAVETVIKIVRICFPYTGEENFIALMRMALHGAENTIERYAFKNNYDIHECETTLAMALFNGTDLYYANSGDSGIIALDNYGKYHVLSKKANDEYGGVYPLSERGYYEVGKADFRASTVICMTDGLLDWVVPKPLSNYEYPVHIPRINLFVPGDIWKKGDSKEESNEEYANNIRDKARNKLKELVQKLNSKTYDDEEPLGSLREGNLEDDLSIAVLIDRDSAINPDDISWNPPPKPTIDEQYLKEWKDYCKLYPSFDARESLVKIIKKSNPDWSNEKIANYAKKIMDIDIKEISNSSKKDNIDKPSFSNIGKNNNSNINQEKKKLSTDSIKEDNYNRKGNLKPNNQKKHSSNNKIKVKTKEKNKSGKSIIDFFNFNKRNTEENHK